MYKNSAPYTFRQNPGPQNSLGTVKYNRCALELIVESRETQRVLDALDGPVTIQLPEA